MRKKCNADGISEFALSEPISYGRPVPGTRVKHESCCMTFRSIPLEAFRDKGHQVRTLIF